VVSCLSGLAEEGVFGIARVVVQPDLGKQLHLPLLVSEPQHLDFVRTVPIDQVLRLAPSLHPPLLLLLPPPVQLHLLLRLRHDAQERQLLLHPRTVSLEPQLPALRPHPRSANCLVSGVGFVQSLLFLGVAEPIDNGRLIQQDVGIGLKNLFLGKDGQLFERELNQVERLGWPFVLRFLGTVSGRIGWLGVGWVLGVVGGVLAAGWLGLVVFDEAGEWLEGEWGFGGFVLPDLGGGAFEFPGQLGLVVGCAWLLVEFLVVLGVSLG